MISLLSDNKSINLDTPKTQENYLLLCDYKSKSYKIIFSKTFMLYQSCPKPIYTSDLAYRIEPVEPSYHKLLFCHLGRRIYRRLSTILYNWSTGLTHWVNKNTLLELITKKE